MEILDVHFVLEVFVPHAFIFITHLYFIQSGILLLLNVLFRTKYHLIVLHDEHVLYKLITFFSIIPGSNFAFFCTMTSNLMKTKYIFTALIYLLISSLYNKLIASFQTDDLIQSTKQHT